MNASEPTLHLALPVRAPFPWTALLGYFATRLIEGVEVIADGAYRRVEAGAVVRVDHDAAAAQLIVTGHGLAADAARRRVERLFVPQHDGTAIAAALGIDPLLAPRLARCPGFRPPGCWSPFELAVRTLLGQQVTVAAARTLTARLVARCGALTPAAIVSADLSALGMPGARVAAIRAFADAVARGDVDLDAPWPALDAQLAGLRGFGPWTRAYLAIRLGRDGDALPDSDIGLLRAAGVATPRALRARAEAWRPYRGHAATLLWAVAP
ncbi:DNA-3-methyladenine glycosylase family protein [Solimonas flava]|uniref:DNA-3-methyladenine glycosylase family protein n=1 Tax=Solimonas flava TaxID=415849 RepID=UPI0003FACCE5|nr:AlkA N-terminal domain-containing protein [Solimonas flava]